MPLSLRHAPGLGTLRVPRGSWWQLASLSEQVAEYFDHGARVRPGDVVVDVGANIGAFAIEAARRAGGPLEIHAFEPAPPLFAALRENLRAHPLLAPCATHPWPVALCERSHSKTELNYFRRFPTDSTRDLGGKREDFDDFFAAQGAHIGRYLPAATRPLSRAAVRSFVRGANSRLGRQLIDLVAGRERYACPARTLSSVIEDRQITQIHLLKIDVEGDELRVLEGLAAQHHSRIAQVILEGHDHHDALNAVIARLHGMGFDSPRITRPRGAEAKGLRTYLVHATKSVH